MRKVWARAVFTLLAVLFLGACGAPDTLHISVSDMSASSGGSFSAMQATVIASATQSVSASAPNGAAQAIETAVAGLKPISQRDRSQYDTDAQYTGNAASACSATAAAMVLNGFGKKVRIADVLHIMQDHGALRNTGLSAQTFPVLRDTLPNAFGLKGAANGDANLDSHVEAIKTQLAQGRAVMADVYDASFFPGGHWIVLTGFVPANRLPASDHGLAIDATSSAWQSGGISVLNPDPDVRNGRSIEQLWPVSAFKDYFSATHLSLVFSPK